MGHQCVRQGQSHDAEVGAASLPLLRCSANYADGMSGGRGLRFTASFDGRYAPNWKLHDSESADQFVITAYLDGKYHITGHDNGRVHLTIAGTQQGTFREHIVYHNNSLPHHVANIVIPSAVCFYDSPHRSPYVATIPSNDFAALFEVGYVPDGCPWHYHPDCQPVGSLKLSRAQVVVTVRVERFDGFSVTADGLAFLPNEPDPSGIGVVSRLTPDGLTVMMGRQAAE